MNNQNAVTSHQKLEKRQRRGLWSPSSSPLLRVRELPSMLQARDGSVPEEISLIIHKNTQRELPSHAAGTVFIPNPGRFILVCLRSITLQKSLGLGDSLSLRPRAGTYERTDATTPAEESLPKGQFWGPTLGCGIGPCAHGVERRIIVLERSLSARHVWNQRVHPAPLNSFSIAAFICATLSSPTKTLPEKKRTGSLSPTARRTHRYCPRVPATGPRP